MKKMIKIFTLFLVAVILITSTNAVSFAAKKPKISKKKLVLKLETEHDWDEISIKMYPKM